MQLVISRDISRLLLQSRFVRPVKYSIPARLSISFPDTSSSFTAAQAVPVIGSASFSPSFSRTAARKLLSVNVSVISSEAMPASALSDILLLDRKSVV